jgi:hypothetical protein
MARVENWKGTTLSFILHYQEQIRLYDQLQPPNSTVPTYKDYEALLKSAASTYDRAHAPAKRQPTRSAECTDIWDANITESFHKAYEFGFDIDTPTDIVQAHMRDQSGVIPKETFG